MDHGSPHFGFNGEVCCNAASPARFSRRKRKKKSINARICINAQDLPEIKDFMFGWKSKRLFLSIFI